MRLVALRGGAGDDEVLRTAQDVEDFEQEITLLKASRSPSGNRPKKVRIDITEGHKHALSTVVQKEGT